MSVIACTVPKGYDGYVPRHGGQGAREGRGRNGSPETRKAPSSHRCVAAPELLGALPRPFAVPSDRSGACLRRPEGQRRLLLGDPLSRVAPRGWSRPWPPAPSRSRGWSRSARSPHRLLRSCLPEAAPCGAPPAPGSSSPVRRLVPDGPGANSRGKIPCGSGVPRRTRHARVLPYPHAHGVPQEPDPRRRDGRPRPPSALVDLAAQHPHRDPAAHHRGHRPRERRHRRDTGKRRRLDRSRSCSSRGRRGWS